MMSDDHKHFSIGKKDSIRQELKRCGCIAQDEEKLYIAKIKKPALEE